MKSHECQFTLPELVRLIAWPLFPVALFAASMHLGAALRWLPSPRAVLDTDRTILFHQAATSQGPHGARLLLTGDSSCLMDVSAEQLEASLPANQSTLNLGTLSYLDLPAYASLLERYFATNSGRVRTVLLLMHPEALRRVAPTDYHVIALNSFFSGIDFCDPATGPLFCWLGGAIFDGRLLSRAIPLPLAGNYGKRYGFTSDLWQYLSEHKGSAIDPGKFDPKSAMGNAEYRLAKQLESASKIFRAAIPANVKLVAGMTPTPESFAGRGFPSKFKELLQGWNEWLHADVILDDLPATLPDRLFASTAHLNEAGRRVYTSLLALILAPELLDRSTR